MCIYSGWSPVITKFRGNYSPLVYLIISSFPHELIMPAKVTKGGVGSLKKGYCVLARARGKCVCLMKKKKTKTKKLSKETTFPTCSVSSQLLFTLVKEPRMKTSSSTKKKQILKVFFAWSFDQEDDGRNISSRRLLLKFVPVVMRRELLLQSEHSQAKHGKLYLWEGSTKPLVNSGISLIDRFSTQNVRVRLVTPYISTFGGCGEAFLECGRSWWPLDIPPSQTSCALLLQKESFATLTFLMQGTG